MRFGGSPRPIAFANTLAALGDCLVGKADDGEGRDARADLDLHVDGARLDPLESDPS
jgi:hypothetical protein